MAKMKTYLVEVEVTTRHYLLVEARRPQGAVDRIMTEEGWAKATRYFDCDECGRLGANRTNAKVITVREV